VARGLNYSQSIDIFKNKMTHPDTGKPFGLAGAPNPFVKIFLQISVLSAGLTVLGGAGISFNLNSIVADIELFFKRFT
jgi:hypothetical protein